MTGESKANCGCVIPPQEYHGHIVISSKVSGDIAGIASGPVFHTDLQADGSQANLVLQME